MDRRTDGQQTTSADGQEGQTRMEEAVRKFNIVAQAESVWDYVSVYALFVSLRDTKLRSWPIFGSGAVLLGSN